MATAIEYGLIAALVAVAGVTAMQSIGVEERPVIRQAACSVESFDEFGRIKLSCPGQPKDFNLQQTNSQLALAHALHPRPLQCDLYLRREAVCSRR